MKQIFKLPIAIVTILLMSYSYETKANDTILNFLDKNTKTPDYSEIIRVLRAGDFEILDEIHGVKSFHNSYARLYTEHCRSHLQNPVSLELQQEITSTSYGVTTKKIESAGSITIDGRLSKKFADYYQVAKSQETLSSARVFAESFMKIVSNNSRQSGSAKKDSVLGSFASVVEADQKNKKIIKTFLEGQCTSTDVDIVTNNLSRYTNSKSPINANKKLPNGKKDSGILISEKKEMKKMEKAIKVLTERIAPLIGVWQGKIADKPVEFAIWSQRKEYTNVLNGVIYSIEDGCFMDIELYDNNATQGFAFNKKGISGDWEKCSKYKSSHHTFTGGGGFRYYPEEKKLKVVFVKLNIGDKNLGLYGLETNYFYPAKASKKLKSFVLNYVPIKKRFRVPHGFFDKS